MELLGAAACATFAGLAVAGALKGYDPAGVGLFTAFAIIAAFATLRLILLPFHQRRQP